MIELKIRRWAREGCIYFEAEQNGKGKWEAKGGSDVKSPNSRARQTWTLICVPALTQLVLM